MNARTPPARYEPGLSKRDLLDAWEVQLSLQLVEHDNGCLEWTGPVGRDGTGTCHAPSDLVRQTGINGTQTIVQALWICRTGGVSNFKLMSACRSPWCVAPEHRLAMGLGRSERLHKQVKAARQRGENLTGLEWRIALREQIEERKAKGRFDHGPRSQAPRKLTQRQRIRENRRRAAWVKRNRERVRVRQRTWRANHLETRRPKERAAQRAYYYRHLEQERAKARERQRALRADPARRAAINARRRARHAEKRAARVQQGTPP